MQLGAHDELILLALLVAMAALLLAAPIARVPYPIFLVLGGLALSFVPGIPDLRLPPDVVLIAVLPPLLYLSAFFTSLRDLRMKARPISLLAVGLVVVTTVTVAAAATITVVTTTRPTASRLIGLAFCRRSRSEVKNADR